MCNPKKNSFLISQPKRYVVGTQKNCLNEHPMHMLKLMVKKIFTILRSKVLFILKMWRTVIIIDFELWILHLNSFTYITLILGNCHMHHYDSRKLSLASRKFFEIVTYITMILGNYIVQQNINEANPDRIKL